MSYALSVPGLADRVAALTPSANHAELLACLSAADRRLAAASRLATTRGDSWLGRRKVIDATGRVVHDDHQEFLKSELASTPAREVMRRLKDLDYRLSQCEITTLYVIRDNGGAQDNFIQAVVLVEDEFVDCRMFDPSDSWREPTNLSSLCDAAEQGVRFDAATRQRVRPSTYRLGSVIDVAAFLREATAIDADRRKVAAGRTLKVTSDRGVGIDGPVTRERTIADLDPDILKYAWRGRRMFDDWTASSAGLSGARLCEHWVLQTSDYTDRGTGVRSMEFIPAWTFPRKLAEVARAKGVYELFGKLESIDRRVRVPFGWYFWMLHGNRVHDWAASRVLAGAEDGLIVLPEHDYQVLKQWNARPYGF